MALALKTVFRHQSHTPNNTTLAAYLFARSFGIEDCVFRHYWCGVGADEGQGRGVGFKATWGVHIHHSKAEITVNTKHVITKWLKS